MGRSTSICDCVDDARRHKGERKGDMVEGTRPAFEEIVHPRARPGDGSEKRVSVHGIQVRLRDGSQVMPFRARALVGAQGTSIIIDAGPCSPEHSPLNERAPTREHPMHHPERDVDRSRAKERDALDKESHEIAVAEVGEGATFRLGRSCRLDSLTPMWIDVCLMPDGGNYTSSLDIRGRDQIIRHAAWLYISLSVVEMLKICSLNAGWMFSTKR